MNLSALPQKTAFVVLLFVLLGTLLYANALKGDFVWDDKSYIEDSQHLRDIGNAALVLDPLKYRTLSGDHTDLTRPLMFLSLLLDYHFWGLNPAGYHGTNVVLHILTSIALFFLGLQLTKAHVPSFLGALIFLVHPVHTEAVTGITFREDVLVTLFYLLSMSCLMKLFDREKRGGQGLLISGVLIAYFFALLSKEMAVTLPAMAVLIYIYFRKEGEGLKGLLFVVVPVTGLTLLYLAWIAGTYLAQPVVPDYPEKSIFYAFVNIPGMIVYYLDLFLFPINLSVDPGYPVSTSFLQPAVLASFFIVFALLYSIYAAYRWKPVFSFLLLWFFVSLLPVLQVVPTYNLVAERFLYLPSASLSLLSGLLLFHLGRRKDVRITVLALVIAFSCLLVDRNGHWLDASTLWTDALKKNDNSYLARISLFNDSFEKEDYTKAEPGFLHIVRRWPDKPEAYNNLGIIYRKQKRYGKAESITKKAIFSGADTPETYYNLAILYRDMERYDEALSEVKRALNLKGELSGRDVLLSEIHAGLGRTRFKAEDFTGAIDAFLTAARFGYAGSNVHRYLAEAYFNTGRFPEAIEAYKRILMINPENSLAYFYLGEAYRETGGMNDALQAYRIFLERWRLGGRHAEKARAMIGEIEKR